MGLKEATTTRLVCRFEIMGGSDSFSALVGQRHESFLDRQCRSVVKTITIR